MRRIFFALVLIFMPLQAALACDVDTCLVIISEGGEHQFAVEIAETDAERSLGLMYRKELAPNAGMLFDFHEEREVAFWMRNTLIPLDMLFIRADGTIANIHPEAVPGDLTSIPSDGPVQFVFEIAGGRASELGIVAGDKMQHVRVVESEAK